MFFHSQWIKTRIHIADRPCIWTPILFSVLCILLYYVLSSLQNAFKCIIRNGILLLSWQELTPICSKCSLGPTPERCRIWGVPIAPALRMISFTTPTCFLVPFRRNSTPIAFPLYSSTWGQFLKDVVDAMRFTQTKQLSGELFHDAGHKYSEHVTIPPLH